MKLAKHRERCTRWPEARIQDKALLLLRESRAALCSPGGPSRQLYRHHRIQQVADIYLKALKGRAHHRYDERWNKETI